MLASSIRCGYGSAHFGGLGFEFAHSLFGRLTVDFGDWPVRKTSFDVLFDSHDFDDRSFVFCDYFA
jgi:hypothetical protein